MTQPMDAGRQERKATLSRDLSEFLIEFSIAVHRYAMYPGDHPSLLPAAENVIKGLSTLFAKREQLSIGVAHKQLVIEGVATDERHPVLSDLGRRLHGHQLGVLSFHRGVTFREVQELLRALAPDAERSGHMLGLLSEEERLEWTHIRLLPLGYEQLGLDEGEDGSKAASRATQLWLGLARVALAKEDVELEDGSDAHTVAQVLSRRTKQGAYDEVIVDYLRQIAEELRDADGSEADEVRRRMAALVHELDPETLEHIVEMGGSFTMRKKFVLDATRGLPVDAVVTVLEAAARASGQTISSSLGRMLSKLAAHSAEGSRKLRAQAEGALRENVEELIADWELEDPNPDAYTRVLDTMARQAPVLSGTDDREMGVAGAGRILQMALEVDAYGPTLEKAVSDLVDEGMVGLVLQVTDSAPEGSQVAEKLRRQLTTPRQLRRLLSGEDVDDESLEQLVRRMGDRALEPLFELLTESESRSVRRKIFDCLVRIGPKAGREAADRLADSRWYVKRNMLALLQRLDDLPEGFEPMRHLRHEDSRVRREAFPLALRNHSLRPRALGLALADSDERIVRMALLEVQEEVPEPLVPVVVNRVLRSESFTGLRSLAVRALGSSNSTLAVEALTRVCVGGRNLLGRPKLAPKSAEMIAALGVLADRWPDHPKAGPLLQIARGAKDLQIRVAASPAGERR